MRKCYLSLVAAILVAVMAWPALGADVKTRLSEPAPYNTGRALFTCDEDVMDSAFYANALNAYGNAFDVGAGGPLSRIEFWHYGWFTLAGPYDYNLRVYDEGTCTEIASLPFEAADAFDHSELEIEDLCPYGVSVVGQIVVGVEPLSCAIPTDCYPDVWFDDTGVQNQCGRIVDVTSQTGCDTPAQGSGGPVDHLLRINVDECGGTPAEDSSWGQLKDLYR